MTDQNILKCDLCKNPFDVYCLPKILDCFKTICTACETNIVNGATENNRFKCGICEQIHSIPTEGLVVNQRIYDLLTTNTAKISRGENFDRLYGNLEKLEANLKMQNYNLENALDILTEHCDEQTRLIQYSTEKKIENIYNKSDLFIEAVKTYKQKCTSVFSNRKEQLKNKMDVVTARIQDFIQEKKEYLRQDTIDENLVKDYYQYSEFLQNYLKNEALDLQNAIFNDEILEFDTDLNESITLCKVLYKNPKNKVIMNLFIFVKS